MADTHINKKDLKFLTKLQVEGAPIRALTLLLLGVNTDALHNHWIKTFVHECEHRGRDQGIKHMKLLYTQAVQYSLYQKIPYVPFRKRYSDNMLKQLSPFRPLLRSNVLETRAALTVLRQFEMLFSEPSNDISTVTEECNIERWSIRRFKFWLYRRRRLPMINIKPPKDHLTSKKGPSRFAALSSYGEDLLSMPQNIRSSIEELSAILGDPIKDRLSEIERILIERNLAKGDKPHSRIQVFSAGGGKTRVIAIVDYWTQRTLKPLHQAIFSNLRKINEDSTFGHESAAEWLKTIPKGVDIYSYDLTASTDRIPYEVHHSVLRSHLPRNQRDDISRLVKDLLINRDFTLSWNENESVRYACGQPMGAYASWALLSYSHHCIARFCGARDNEYRIIGDDIVILGKAGKNYRKFMNSIGVTISEGKSIISLRDSKHQTGEVAKRLIRDGVEISPPTAKLIYQCYKDWRLAPILLSDIVRRGWVLTEGPLLGYLASTYSKSWYAKVISVLTYPFGDDLTASYIRGVVKSQSPWVQYEPRALAVSSVRYRIALLNRTAALLYKGINPYMVYAGGPPSSDGVDAELYALSPERSVRIDMVSNIFNTINSIDNALNLIEVEEDFERFVPSIRDEELYAPDITLKFLEKKYQRANFYSNLLLNMKKRIDSGTLQDFLREREIPSNLDVRLLRGSILGSNSNYTL